MLDALKPQPIAILLAAMREAIAQHNWSPCKEVLQIHGEYKSAAWKLLTAKEKQQLTALVPEAIKLLTQAKRRGAIARWVEDDEGGLYWIWRTSDSPRELVISIIFHFGINESPKIKGYRL